MHASAFSALQPPRTQKYKTSLVVLLVVGLHVLLLWALQQGSLKPIKPLEIVIPIKLSMIQPKPEPIPVPKLNPKPTPKPIAEPKPQPKPNPAPPPLTPPPPPAIQPVPATASVVNTAIIAADAVSPPTAASKAPVAASSNAASANAATANAAPSAAPSKTLPSSYADDTYTPEKSYPRFSIKMGEEGEVFVRVFIGTDGLPKKAEVQRSSGFERLDEAALDYVMRSRYKAGTQDGAPAAMWMGRMVRYKLKS